MSHVLPDPLVGRIATGVLLLVGGAAAFASSLVSPSHPVSTAGLAAVAASLITSLLGMEPIRHRRVLRAVVAGASLLVAGLLLRSVSSDAATLAAPAAGAAVLLWAALAWGRGGAAQLAVPAGVASVYVWMSGAAHVPFGAFGILPVALLLAEALALPLERSRATRTRADLAVADIDSLLVAALDLRGVEDVPAAGARICRIATEMLRRRRPPLRAGPRPTPLRWSPRRPPHAHRSRARQRSRHRGGHPGGLGPPRRAAADPRDR